MIDPKPEVRQILWAVAYGRGTILEQFYNLNTVIKILIKASALCNTCSETQWHARALPNTQIPKE